MGVDVEVVEVAMVLEEMLGVMQVMGILEMVEEEMAA